METISQIASNSSHCPGKRSRDVIQFSNKSIGLTTTERTEPYTADDLEPFVRAFLQTRGIFEKQEDRIAPAYSKSLIKYDFETMVEVLTFLSDAWDSSQLPSVAEIVQQYKILKSRVKRIRESTEKAAEPQKAARSVDFWEEYNRCRAAGMEDLNVIAQYLVKISGSTTLPEKVCPNSFCDGNGYVVAARVDDKNKSEVLFTCKCNFKPAIEPWDYPSGFEIVRGVKNRN